MPRLLSGLALALVLAACNTTGGTQVAATGEDATLSALQPAAGTTADPAASSVDAASTEVAALEASPIEETPAVDEKANAYLNCVVGHAARESQGGEPEDDAVEAGIDSCRNEFRAARDAYRDSGVSQGEADRYGVNLLTFVRDEAHSFLQSGT